MADKVLRCAVYTRKSTEDGLEQEFNSLDAQYEACAAYAMSQRHEGWLMVPERYDDGGFSGGNLNRPGLKRLLDDVAAGKVQVILVYKIDRLTRSLSDFAKIVDVLDAAQASFVSITQSFNTTSSMGRLTLNMLLSFAQFEREVTGERIRDKIAASKRKGMWMGGTVPLGYDVENRRLIANESEAELVRHIMTSYLEVGSVDELADRLNAQGHRTKVQVKASGPHRGGCEFRRGTLFHMLTNPIYRGRIVHKGEVFPGEHEPLVSEELWDKVQRKLKDRTSGISRRLRANSVALLTGMLLDGEDRPMSPTHATKGGKRYRYYATRADLARGSSAWRVSAHDLEQLVCTRAAELLCNQHGIVDLLGPVEAQQVAQALAQADLMAATLRSGSPSAKHQVLQSLLDQVWLGDEQILIHVSRTKLLVALKAPPPPFAAEPIILACPATKVRRGHQLRLVIPGPEIEPPSPPLKRDERLVALLAEAHAARKLVLGSAEPSINVIAKANGRCRKQLMKLMTISSLAPDIVMAAIEGRQPLTLTRSTLLKIDLPIAWCEQRKALGFT